MSLKVLISVVVVALVFVAFAMLGKDKAPVEQGATQQPSGSGTNVAATGEVSDVLDALFAETEAERSAASQENGAALNADAQALNDFGQSYDNAF